MWSVSSGSRVYPGSSRLTVGEFLIKRTYNPRSDTAGGCTDFSPHGLQRCARVVQTGVARAATPHSVRRARRLKRVRLRKQSDFRSVIDANVSIPALLVAFAVREHFDSRVGVRSAATSRGGRRTGHAGGSGRRHASTCSDLIRR